MNNFTFQNPVRIEFGKGKISVLSELVPKDQTIMLIYGGGSIKKNGVYDQVRNALGGRKVEEYGGIEANPQYSTCMGAVERIREKSVGFLLAVGGGSVIDATKFIAAAVRYQGDDPWKLVTGGSKIEAAMPFGTVLTLPATGSEMNTNSVISRKEIGQKLAFSSPLVYPRFSILDPETTMSLPPRQIGNGIVDTFVHVSEQYLTFPVNGALQDRFAEGILLTLIQEGPKALKNPKDYDTRANLMWSSTLALNHLISAGVPSDWATHGIGHELTALYGLDHARTLAIVLPGTLRNQIEQKKEKMAQYGSRVWGLNGSDLKERAEQAVQRTEEFFESVGVPTTLRAYDISPEAADLVAERIGKMGGKLGEHGSIGPEEVRQILSSRIG